MHGREIIRLVAVYFTHEMKVVMVFRDALVFCRLRMRMVWVDDACSWFGDSHECISTINVATASSNISYTEYCYNGLCR
jgi:hypothetical protein